MNYSPYFKGWLGRVAYDVTHDSVLRLVSQLAPYFTAHSTSGQKLIIGYDTRYFAKKFAEMAAAYFAKEGIKVFISNKPAPSSVLVTSALHKKSMGTLVFTGDENDASFLGVRVYGSDGYALKLDAISKYNPTVIKDAFDESTFRKWVTKGAIEPFDPSIPYNIHIDNTFSFSESVPSTTFTMFNPLYGSGAHFFDRILHDRGLHGYSMHNERTSDFKRLEPTPSLHFETLYDDMVFHGAELGFMTSPDCSLVEFFVGAHRLLPKEVLYLISEHLILKNGQLTILLTDGADIHSQSLTRLGATIVHTSIEQFDEQLRTLKPNVALDQMGRFYFEHHGAPDGLMVGFILALSLNLKTLSTAKMEQKINQIKELL